MTRKALTAAQLRRAISARMERKQRLHSLKDDPNPQVREVYISALAYCDALGDVLQAIDNKSTYWLERD